MYAPLKITTDYTLMKSLISIPRLIRFAQENNLNVLGICDDNLYGALEFYDACLENNIKPIVGLEIELNNFKVYLYAKNYLGYQNLLKINTEMQKGKLDKSIYNLFNENINIILPFRSLDLFDSLSSVTAIIYFSYTSSVEKNKCLLLTNNIIFIPDIKVFSLNDSVYLNYLTLIDNQEFYDETKLIDYSMNAYEYYNSIGADDQAFIEKFVLDINIDIPKKGYHIPEYNAEIDSNKLLISLSKKGLEKRLQGKLIPEYINRLKFELDVIFKMGFIDYFLIVYDYVLYAKKNDILVGPGRGSAVGSLVSYCLGITDIDPIKYNLLFERFLNPERITMPDIDIDFEYIKRDRVVKYVKERYGVDKVAGIITFGTLTSKVSFTQVCKIYKLNDRLISKVSKLIDPKSSLQDNLSNEKIKQLLNQNELLKKYYQIAYKFEGLKRYFSTHASGIVICNEPLDNLIPVHYSGSEIISGFSMNYLEELGILKMDFLGLKNLTLLQNIFDMVNEYTNDKLGVYDIPLDDKETLELFSKAKTLGIFQFEGMGMKKFLFNLKPDSFKLLIAAIALYRPGPMQYIDEFVDRKNGKKEVQYLHSDIKDIVSETFGIMIYQEQIMQVLAKIGGYSYSQADNIRRAMSKKKKEVIANERDYFVDEALKRGYEKNIAELIYDDVLKFAGYGFNKSHSVSYAILAYEMAYLKVHYPLYFIVNHLNINHGDEEKIKEFYSELRGYGYKMLKADINYSTLDYIIKDNAILNPLIAINQLDLDACKRIIEERNDKGIYEDYLDFITRMSKIKISDKQIEVLIDASALDQFEINRSTMKNNISSFKRYAGLVNDIGDNLVHKPILESYDEESEDNLRKSEINSYGFYISNHPSTKYNDGVKLQNIDKFFNKIVKCYVLIDKVRSIKTKNNEDMAFVNTSDETGSIEFIFFPKKYSLIEDVQLQDFCCIEGKVEKRLDSYQIVANKLWKRGSINE